MHYARLIEEYQRDNAKSKVIDIKYIPFKLLLWHNKLI